MRRGCHLDPNGVFLESFTLVVTCTRNTKMKKRQPHFFNQKILECASYVMRHSCSKIRVLIMLNSDFGSPKPKLQKEKECRSWLARSDDVRMTLSIMQRAAAAFSFSLLLPPAQLSINTRTESINLSQHSA